MAVRRLGCGLLLLLLLAAIGAAISNATAPTHSQIIDRLSDAERARLAEAIHLRRTLGEHVWPGWGDAEIPVVLYNEAYVFLAGYANPPVGWYSVPAGELQGDLWQMFPGEAVADAPYYRQALSGAGITPQAFTVRVGDRWAASLTTREWTEIALAQQIRGDLPPVLRWLVPYRLFVGFLLGNSDLYIALIQHESFHAYQGMVVPERLLAADRENSRLAALYPWNNGALQAAWQAELDLLYDALQAESHEVARTYAQQFLQQRAERRTLLDPALADYERQREWVEGLAKYVELESWRQAALAPDYEPVTAMRVDPDFAAYTTFARRWQQEVDQLRRTADDEGDGRFYYTGMAQAVLLDRFSPGWKTQILTQDVWLEGLLQDEITT